MSSTSPSTFDQTARPANLNYLGRDPVAIGQASWFIDPVNGGDNQTGLTAATALRTHAELVRRWGQGYPTLPGALSAVLFTPFQLVTVNILGSLPASDPIDLKLSLPTNMLLAYVGTPTTVRTGTLTTATAKAPATNQAFEIADAVTPFTVADVGRRVFITGGANVNQFAWVARDLGAGLMRMSSFSNVTLPPPSDFLMLTGLVSGTVGIGDAYAVQTLPRVTIANLDFRSPISGPGFVNLSKIAFANLELFNDQGVLQIIPSPEGAVSASFKGCRFLGQQWVAPTQFRFTYLNCCFGPTLFAAVLSVQLAGHAFRGGLALGSVATRGTAVCVFDDDFMVQGGFGFGVQSVGVSIGALCAFDAFNEGVNIGAFIPATSLLAPVFAGVSRLWGSGNGTFGFKSNGNSNLNYASTVPTITGALGDFSLGGATTAYGVDAAGVVQASFATGGAPGVGWANLVAAQPAGGGGNAHNHAANSHICLQG